MARTFGVHTGQQDCSLEELRRLWRFVDQAGFDWLSVWDHFYEAPPIDGNGSCFEMFEGGMLFGTSKQAVERVGQYFDLGASPVTIALRAPFYWDALRGYVEEVLPAFNG